MLNVKRASSSWIKNRAPGSAIFAWQDGYFAFSLGLDSVDALRAYFDGQAAHHRTVDFKEEVLSLLARHRVEFDPRYLWD